jgi:two-component system phosphate regulon sensor histidine kinase PhoR
MNPLFRLALFRLSLYLFIGLLIGNEIDNLLLGITGSLFVYIFWVLFNYRRFQRWLDDGVGLRKPILNTFWQSIADQVYRVVEGQRAQNRELQQELDFFKDSYQALDSALIVINKRGNIDWANRAAKTMLGIDAETDTGELLVNLLVGGVESVFCR